MATLVVTGDPSLEPSQSMFYGETWKVIPRLSLLICSSGLLEICNYLTVHYLPESGDVDRCCVPATTIDLSSETSVTN